MNAVTFKSPWTVMKFMERQRRLRTAVITVEPAGKTSFVYSCTYTRPMSKYNGESPISLVYVSKPHTVISAIEGKYNLFLTILLINL